MILDGRNSGIGTILKKKQHPTLKKNNQTKKSICYAVKGFESVETSEMMSNPSNPSNLH